MKNLKRLTYPEDFQLNRVISFSDAVFSIAMTLLVLEIKIPVSITSPVNDAMLWETLKHIMPKFIGFLISFFVIALYWLAHNRLFKNVILVNQNLIWNNLFFLLSIILMPFSTAFFSEYYISSLKLPLFTYTLTICLSGFFNFRLWQIIGNPKNKLSKPIDKVIVNYNSVRSLIVPFIFILTFLFSYFTGWSYFITFFTPFVPGLITRYYLKKYPEKMKAYFS